MRVTVNSATRKEGENNTQRNVTIELPKLTLQGTLGLPNSAKGIVLFAHGSGSSRLSPRNRFVANEFQSRGIATLLFDLLTPQEEAFDQQTSQLRFNIPFLAKRLVGATRWVLRNSELLDLKIGYFGASTGAAAALTASAQRPDTFAAVVSRGGRPDLAEEALASVQAPTLLIVGGNDAQVIALNQLALAGFRCREKKLLIIPGATHLFEEPGALAKVAGYATEWFACRFAPIGDSQVRQATQTR